MPDKDLIIFDLDGTLAPSKSPLEPDMAELLMKLLAKKKVAVVSGGNKQQFRIQFLSNMPDSEDSFKNLIILPTSGAVMEIWDGSKWEEKYAERLNQNESAKIITALEESLEETGTEEPDILYGPRIEDRGTQVTFSALGQQAPVDEKEKWDPDQSKRKMILSALIPKIPEFSAYIGGATSIDVTRKGVNKGFAVHKLEENLKIPIERMLFVGDKVFPGGNDYAAKEAGAECIQVANPEETKKLIREWLRK